MALAVSLHRKVRNADVIVVYNTLDCDTATDVFFLEVTERQKLFHVQNCSASSSENKTGGKPALQRRALFSVETAPVQSCCHVTGSMHEYGYVT